MSLKKNVFIALALIFMSSIEAIAGNENGGGGARCKSDFFERLLEIEKISNLDQSLNQEYPFLSDLFRTSSPVTNPNFTVIVSESPIQNCPNTAGPMACSNPSQNTLTLFCGSLGWDSLAKEERQKLVIHELLWWNPNYDDRNYFYSTTLNQKLIRLATPATVCERSTAVRNFLVNYYKKPCDQISNYDFGDLESLELDHVSELKSGDFDGFLSLKKLYIGSEGQIGSIPEDIFDPLNNLIELGLWGAKIQNVPVGLLKQLPLLKVFDWHSGLTSIPENIFTNNIKLESISLYQNNLNLISANIFANNHKLKAISLSENKIKVLPIGVFNNLYQLKYLDIRANPDLYLTAEVFDPIPNLKTIEFDYSSWSSNIFLGLLEIERVDVNVLQMKNVAADFIKQFPYLKTAFFYVLQNKEIDQINEDFISNSKQLEAFGVSGANFVTLPLKLVNRNRNLRWINFAECNLFYLPAGFFVPFSGFPRDNFLILRDNHLSISEQERIKIEINDTSWHVDLE